jgi:hypothetical protein
VKRSELVKDVYVRLALAAAAGKGVRLTADEVWKLVQQDDAINTAAVAYCDEHGWALGYHTGELRRAAE